MTLHPMTNRRTVSPFTLLGLLVAGFGVSLVTMLFRLAAPDGQLTNAFVVARELSVFAVAGLLLLIVTRGEKLGLASIGLHGRHWGKSLLWSVLIYGLCMIAALAVIGICHVLEIKEHAGFKLYQHVSPWVMTLVMVRAGIVEEICYRGYLMERLEKINGHWAVTVLLPSVFFGLLHYTQGPRGMLIAFALGLVMALTYRKTRDLKANIIAHFLIDFISNVLPLLTK